MSSMIKTTKAFLDNSGGVRLYISRDIVSELGWRDDEPLILSTSGKKLTIIAESANENQSWLESLKKGSSESKAAQPGFQGVLP